MPSVSAASVVSVRKSKAFALLFVAIRVETVVILVISPHRLHMECSRQHAWQDLVAKQATALPSQVWAKGVPSVFRRQVQTQPMEPALGKHVDYAGNGNISLLAIAASGLVAVVLNAGAPVVSIQQT